MWIYLLCTVLIICLGIGIFLILEFKKKFAFMQNFIKSSNQLIELDYEGQPNNPGMGTIILEAEKPFSVLIGFNLTIRIFGKTLLDGFDYYGQVTSVFYPNVEKHCVIISTWLGRSSCIFQFFTNCDLQSNPVEAEIHTEFQSLVPLVTYKPHWWQKLGWWG